ncbi:TPA: hypothetical protein VHG60_000853 [Streptococcus pyogenes]|nr:hypothetical protein [Streptococcus pyogenes]HEQ5938979.1 hypothetical protein [Streptococcus pyogenes]
MQEMRVLKGEVNKYKYNWRCVLVGACCTLRLITPNTFTGKPDTEDELYDEITIKTDKNPYIGFNESEIKSIEIVK